MLLSFFNQIIVPVLVLAGIGLIFGALIAIVSKIFYVEKDTKLETVINMLPGYNCGACGRPGCSQLAEDIVYNGASVADCKPIRQDQADLIRQFLKKQEQTS